MTSQKKVLFVPADYKVPTIFETDEFRLRMLSIEDVEMDYEAVMDSVTHLSKVWPDSGWPEGLTLQKNLIDLAWHQKEFERRTSFAYTVVTLNEERVIGCVYFYPTVKRGYDAEIFLWPGGHIRVHLRIGRFCRLKPQWRGFRSAIFPT